MPGYQPQAIEPKWQTHWESQHTFRTPDDPSKPKYYILDMFPYPSGDGLHVGHPEGYTATDILARYKRMRGFDVLHPMGWDAFGLPAEQHAIKTGTHPRVKTQENIATFRRQIKMLGFSYDWDREVDTTDPDYFRWTQWIFLLLHDTWYDRDAKKGRPIAELTIPADVSAQGPRAVAQYRDARRLAYQAEVPVNWCAELGTVLANEEVIDGKSERGGHPVVRIPLRQWLLRITEYADRLLDDLAIVDWPEPIKKMQRDWIGRSEGAEVDFEAPNAGASIRVFTTRPDTLFGATYLVLAPEHPLVASVTAPERRAAVEEYRTQASRKSDLERTDLAKTKTGVFTGGFATNPVNGERVPIWIADYVLGGYGTGAIMAVPAHDERDFAFAKTFDLPVRVVVAPPASWFKDTRTYQTLVRLGQQGSTPADATLTAFEAKVLKKAAELGMPGADVGTLCAALYVHAPSLFECFSAEGVAVHSGRFDGQPTAQFQREIVAWLETQGKGTKKVNTKLRDWLFSRQRYWGEPFPLLHEVDGSGAPTGIIEPADALPVSLPALDDFKPSGRPEPPLAKAREWVEVERDGRRFLRETNTMPQWAGSCWYYLRYVDPKNTRAFADGAKLGRWLPVDLYVGGAEHAVLHLLYSRFWHKVLFDRGHVPCPEPFQRLVNQGMILGEMEFTGFRAGPDWVSAEKVEYDGGKPTFKVGGDELKAVKLPEDAVEKKGDAFVLKEAPSVRVDARAFKMSKSRGNVINPDKVISEYGADSLRLYEMFMGPLEATKPWSMRGVEGVYRFLSRVWRLTIDDRAETTTLLESVQETPPDAETLRKLHQTIKKVTEDLDAMAFNTAISAMMELTNHLTPLAVRPASVLRTFALLLAPFAPHLAEELWQALGGKKTLAYEPWPTWDASLLVADSVEIPVQVGGKVKAKLTVPTGLDAAALEKLALADERVQALVAGKTIRKIVCIPGKMVNLVVS